MEPTEEELAEQRKKEQESLQTDVVKNAIKDAVTSAVKEATEGLETNRDTILAEKRTLVDELKASQEAAKKFEGLDVDKIRTMIDAVNQSDEAKLISEGKIDEVISARTQSVKNGYEQQFVEKDLEIKSLKESNSSFQNMYESKLIGDSIRAEAIKQGMLPEAVDNAIGDSRGLFTVGEDGNVQASKADEFINSPERFIKSLKDLKAFYWPSNADFRMNGSSGMDSKDIASRMEAAATSGDFEAYKKLRDGTKSK